MGKWLNRAIMVGGAICVAAAIAQELEKPEEERTWNGVVFGWVPYDFRRPTLERMMASYWNPDDPRIMTPHVFGLGWAVNVPSLMRTLYAIGAQLRTACGC